MITENSVVISTKGKDINKIYAVIKIEDNFAYLTDGKVKNLNNLKRKNLKHLKFLCKMENLDFKSMHNCDIIFWLKKLSQKNKLGGIL